jgi:SpoVK/Ycf46/Vps4 family AAA+-type ATPase
MERFSNSNVLYPRHVPTEHTTLNLMTSPVGTHPPKNKIILLLTMIYPHLAILDTEQSWKELALDKETLKQVEEIKGWLKQSSTVKPGSSLGKKLKPGYRTLFYGPAGTGKTSTAALIGKELNKEVYKIDLSQLVSKYIGETEKNLELVFASAKDKDWILFFDEADALFGKRTDIKDAHDRYANQEVSYLLQRMEEYNGLAILATNLKGNIDEAFTRRFNSVIRFK